MFVVRTMSTFSLVWFTNPSETDGIALILLLSMFEVVGFDFDDGLDHEDDSRSTKARA